jgi:GLPGLI family protein
MYSLNGFTQKISGRIIYYYKTEKEIFNPQQKRENVKKIFKGFSEDLKNSEDKITFELIFNQSESYYKIIKKLESDYDKGLNFAILITGGNEEIYINIKNNLKRKKIKAFDTQYLVNSDFKDKWKLTQESKKIGQFICYKAFLIKEITDFYGKKKKLITEAWYTPEIPVNFGPKGFGNLPGLILELQQGNIIYYAQKIEFNKDKSIIINKPTKGKLITEEDFSSLLKEADKKRRKRSSY